MPDIGSSQLDLIVYIVPGYVVLLSIVYTLAPQRLAAQRERLGAGEVLGSLIGALLIGIFIHQIATFAFNLLDNWFAWPTYAGIVKRFKHVDQVRTKVARLLGFAP